MGIGTRQLMTRPPHSSLTKERPNCSDAPWRDYMGKSAVSLLKQTWICRSQNNSSREILSVWSFEQKYSTSSISSVLSEYRAVSRSRRNFGRLFNSGPPRQVQF